MADLSKQFQHLMRAPVPPQQAAPARMAPPAPAQPLSREPMMTQANIAGVTATVPAGVAEQARARTIGAKQGELETAQAQGQQILAQSNAEGTGLEQLGFADVFRATGGDIGATNAFFKARNAVESKTSNLKEAQQATQGVIESLMGLAAAIPSQPGIQGALVQRPLNAMQAAIGELPELTVYTKYAQLAAPLIRKALGDTGNIGEKESRTAIDALESLVSPNSKERVVSQRILGDIFTKAFGRKVALTPAKTQQAVYGVYQSPDGRVFQARTKKEADKLQSLGATRLQGRE